MAEPIKPVQNQPTQDPIAGPVSALPRPEGPPVGLVERSEQQDNGSPEVAIEHGPEFAPEHQLDERVANAGVVSYPSRPTISEEAQNAGLTHTIPPNLYAIDKSITQQAAEEIVRSGSVNKSGPWRALKFLRNLRRSLFGGERKASGV